MLLGKFTKAFPREGIILSKAFYADLENAHAMDA